MVKDSNVARVRSIVKTDLQNKYCFSLGIFFILSFSFFLLNNYNNFISTWILIYFLDTPVISIFLNFCIVAQLRRNPFIYFPTLLTRGIIGQTVDFYFSCSSPLSLFLSNTLNTFSSSYLVFFLFLARYP